MERNCEHCNQPFEVHKFKGKGHRFCSVRCREKAYYINNEERIRKQISDKGKADRKLYGMDRRWLTPRAQELKVWYEEVKSKPCTDCGNCFPMCCMEFDHVRGEKKGEVGSMVAHLYSIETIKLEAAKCELICANCHKIRTRDRKLKKDQDD